ncbi:gamma-glutamylcyclotransferase-like [Spodoptera litura]|uniref:gamma-glutamylcyclotransferase n=1 Tax=Spodoptera litura TaxID=69820 RepID=A0A9J7IQ93_SPOLT|nr:gamma-glutamylcyclotransferase-like [Spodoptera litura]
MHSKTILPLMLISLFKLYYCVEDVIPPPGSTFYFAYGSNLLTKRLHLNNPSAVFYSIAKLADYRLDFNYQMEAWQGAVATIVEDKDAHVWGTVWTMDTDQLHYLDDQEGVAIGLYYAKNVTVTTPSGQQLVARTYIETKNPEKAANGTDIPMERRPSNTYLEVIALGAIESHLPADYIGYIFSFPTNGKMASKTRREELGYPF